MSGHNSEILVISDLHLSADQPEVIKLFVRFCELRAVHASALYILGDFFEVWLGDDDPAPTLKAVFDALAKLAENNVPIYFMRGNRDFLVQKAFEKRAHCTLIEDPYCLEINHNKMVMMHGDSLCTDDIDYQTFKATVRSEQWIDEFLAKDLNERQTIVDSLRKTSKSETAMKKEEIMDVNNSAVLAAFKQHDVKWLIHGHTHRPGVHEYQSDDKQGDSKLTRIVLGDWHQSGSVLSIKNRQEQPGFDFELERFD